ncbi:helix-turn-helix domain-containing protein [Clostridium botulinum]|uniref:helix-turn-helix domain-containing protein n=1 Tax=Clostridium botulinum TaxID=1491 RepID=UPI001C9A3A76|nr:helix-turn-helix domain-containing protein [Clostridium botulinum]MBY6838736.1 helix-turn-helix domain-containing protein [Clostridium botulinum]
MIGLEYICNLYNKSYNSVAEELGISRQSINGWVKGLRPIPKKHLPKLSNIFDGVYKEYFQKELTEIDKINIQKTKVFNECRHLGLTLEEL